MILDIHFLVLEQRPTEKFINTAQLKEIVQGTWCNQAIITGSRNPKTIGLLTHYERMTNFWSMKKPVDWGSNPCVPTFPVVCLQGCK